MTRRAEPPSGGRQRPSIYDVARRAEVSHMTVSRVLNDHPNLREATRARVLRAIDELNFVPSSIARSLATRSARRIGVLIDAPAQSGPTSTLHALEKAARQVGYAVTALSIGDDQALQVGAGADELVALRVEALCVIAPRESSLDLLRRHRIGVPVVVVAPAPDSFWRTVCVDQRAGARLAVRHLVELGHRRIAHLAGPLDWFDARERAEGWRECLAEAGLGEGPLVVGDWTSDFGFASARDLDPAQDTAVFAANDQIALGLVNGLHRRGIRVPEDVSVVGFDDLADSRHFLPPLTTVRQDFAALGESALRHVMAVVQGDEAEPAHDTIQPELIVRGSTRARHGG